MVVPMKLSTSSISAPSSQLQCKGESASDDIDPSYRCSSTIPLDDDGNSVESDCSEVEKSSLHLHSCESMSRHHERTMSSDRRRTESVQFFQAVGEAQEMSQDIEIVDTAGEEDSLDDEDQGAQEIRGRSIIKGRQPQYLYLRRRRWSTAFKLLPTKSWVEEMTSVREDLNYRGIGEAGMEITRCGLQRGNSVTLHRKAWLEVSDAKHRYGKNLRIYYRHWVSLGFPTNNFFQWLDSTGEAEGEPLPDLSECPRAELDSDTVLYITDPNITQNYAISIVADMSSKRARILDNDGEPVRTGAEGWIFVLRDNILYGSRKVTAVTSHSKQRFHHSSFFGGKAVSAAGIIVTDDDGFLNEVHPHSGHYRPSEPDMQRCLLYLYSRGVSLETFEVDMQQIFRISRQKEPGNRTTGGQKTSGSNKKKQKKNCLFLKSASYAAYFLSHKAKAFEEGLYKRISCSNFLLRSLPDDTETCSSGSGSDGTNCLTNNRAVE